MRVERAEVGDGRKHRHRAAWMSKTPLHGHDTGLAADFDHCVAGIELGEVRVDALVCLTLSIASSCAKRSAAFLSFLRNTSN